MPLNTKSLLRKVCKYVYFAGYGNCWYEDIYHETILYQMYSKLTFSIYTTMILLENIAALFGSFPEVEKNSSVMFSAIHNIVLAKMFLLYYHKASIRKLNYEMATVGAKFEEDDVMKKQYLKVTVGIWLYVISVYLSLGAYGIESARRAIVEGTPFYTVVTYLPVYDDNSVVALIFRIFFYVTWLYMMLPMMSADCMPITHLITLTYKFITLCHHFERIRIEFHRDIKVMNKRQAIDKLKAGCLEGIRMHQKLLYLADEIHRVFGIIMSLQVCESSAVAVLLLLRLALSPHLDLTNAFMTYTFVGSLFLLLALNLWNAGEVTYQILTYFQKSSPDKDSYINLLYVGVPQGLIFGTTLPTTSEWFIASLLSSAMFYNCGWHLCELEKDSQRDIRSLTLIGCTQAQKPLILKAFGIQDLSYETFVSVARMTYSVFAVFYHRGE